MPSIMATMLALLEHALRSDQFCLTTFYFQLQSMSGVGVSRFFNIEKNKVLFDQNGYKQSVQCFLRLDLLLADKIVILDVDTMLQCGHDLI